MPQTDFPDEKNNYLSIYELVCYPVSYTGWWRANTQWEDTDYFGGSRLEAVLCSKKGSRGDISGRKQTELLKHWWDGYFSFQAKTFGLCLSKGGKWMDVLPLWYADLTFCISFQSEMHTLHGSQQRSLLCGSAPNLKISPWLSQQPAKTVGMLAQRISNLHLLKSNIWWFIYALISLVNTMPHTESEEWSI